jgi:nicotinate-nucleotide pyrophosphorylase (carboxylating)
MAVDPQFDVNEFVRRVLAEDMGSGGDITSAATIGAEARFTAEMNCRQPITIAGLDIAIAFFRALDRDVRIEKLLKDGDSVPAGSDLMRLEGNARAMLCAERSALNTLQHLSGIATLTRQYVDRIEGTGATLLDTRKTIPGLWLLEKYAARMGGAENHRMRMDDGLLIKDNHVGVCGGVVEAVRAAREYDSGLQIQVEVDRIEQI